MVLPCIGDIVGDGVAGRRKRPRPPPHRSRPYAGKGTPITPRDKVSPFAF
jgi:hypothetical protein